MADIKPKQVIIPPATKFRPVYIRDDRHGIWFVQRTDPEKFVSQSPHDKAKGREPVSYAQNFDDQSSKKLGQIKLAFGNLKNLIENFDPDHLQKEILEMKKALEHEINYLKTSFERAHSGRYVLTLTSDPLGEPLYKQLENQFAEVLFQLEELRQCAEQERYAYTIEKLVAMYAELNSMTTDLGRYVKSHFDETVKRKIGRRLSTTHPIAKQTIGSRRNHH